MKTLEDLVLPPHIHQALQEAQDRITKEFAVDRMVLFGSTARGTADEESDVDLLIVLKESPSHQIRNRISSIIFGYQPGLRHEPQRSDSRSKFMG